MSRMQRGLVHAAAWTLATGAAVTLSWFGVHTVLSGTAYDAPRALPLTGRMASSATEKDDAATPRVSSTHRPRPSPSPDRGPTPDKGTPSHPATPSHSGAPRSRYPGSSSPGGSAPAADGRVKSYATAGGRVVFDMGSRSAELVSATPNSGWEMQVWKQDGWIRVDFSGGAGHTSVFCTWNGHSPTVETTGNGA
ncbi:hypothetical protein AB0G60_06295 [Streptomyces angustmyceticus]|uniref:hypothetical protein n=1 Tax=Streptomyces angustmyceticus TaxID=285578 RepID=UPI0015818AFD|nr:hypothetical protein [Streptomyces angustmyceticus]UAL69081.1 hypothetical protein K7396_23225 [Streptomyces angustmyceticus]